MKKPCENQENFSCFFVHENEWNAMAYKGYCSTGCLEVEFSGISANNSRKIEGFSDLKHSQQKNVTFKWMAISI